jgi:hypothetical protein
MKVVLPWYYMGGIIEFSPWAMGRIIMGHISLWF